MRGRENPVGRALAMVLVAASIQAEIARSASEEERNDRAAAATSPEPSGGKQPTGVRAHRVWSDASGKDKIEAALVDAAQGKVRLKKAHGQVIVVALEKLSKADQDYINRWAALRKEHPWLDTNAPFDVVKFLEPIANMENAALLYADALFEFSADATDLLPPEEQERRRPFARKRAAEHRRLDEAWGKDPKSVNPAEMDAWLAEYESGFRKLALAQQRPRCAFPCPVSFFWLSGHVHAAREVARVLAWRSRRDLARGDFERPIQGVEMVLRLSRDIRHRGDSICQLVSVALDGMCCDTMVREILLAPGLRREHCDRLLAALARHEAEAVDPFLESQRVEYLRTRKLLWDYQHRTDVFDMKTLKDKYGAEGPLVFPFASLSLMWALQGTGDGHRLAREKLRLLREADVPGKRPAKSAEFARRVMSMTTEDLAEEVEVVNRVFAAILGSRGMTLLQRSRACDDPKVVEPLRETCVAVFFEPQEFVTISKVCLREETILRGTLCLVALRRWQLDHREPPKDLDTLVKAAGVKGVPIDPYCDQPLRTTVLEDVSVVYSVGPDGKDDGARTVWDFNPSHPGDIVFRLEPPRR